MEELDSELNELSFRAIGLLYKTYNRLGYGYQEKYYQRGYVEELTDEGLKFLREIPYRIKYNNKIIGRYHLDFLIESRLVVEMKVANDFYLKHQKQILAYLKSTGLRLGILGIFTPDGVKIKRIIN